MIAPITHDLGQFVARICFQDLPHEAVRIAKLGFIDCVGVMIAGRVEEAPRKLMEALDPTAGPSSLLFSSRRAPAPDAALINGTAAHVLDYDDVAMRGHLSSVMVPAILAEAEHLNASGEQMIAAYVAGYEVWGDLIERDADLLHTRGWHVTGWLGALSAAAACAVMRGLSAAEAATALSIAASECAGLMVNTGTMTKPFHAGRAAQAGVLAARLASVGFTAAPDGLESDVGLIRAMSPAGRVDIDTPVAAGAPWRITDTGLSLRRHAVCYCGHRLVDAMLKIADETGLKWGDVAAIEARPGRANAGVLRYHQPATVQEAKFSAEFAVAAALVKGRIAPGDLDAAFVTSEPIRSLIARTTVTALDDAPGTGRAPAEWVTVRKKDGVDLSSGPITAIVGSPARPLTVEQVRAKFTDCLRHGGGGVLAHADQLFNRLLALETLAGARELQAYCG